MRGVLAAVFVSVLVLSSVVPNGVEAAKYDGKKHFNSMMATLNRRGFKTFIKCLKDTGYNNTLRTMLNDYQLTVLAFTNKALADSVTAKQAFKDKKKGYQVMAYHTLGGKHTFKQLLKYPDGTQIKTLDYEQVVFNVRATAGQVRIGPSGTKTDLAGMLVQKDLTGVAGPSTLHLINRVLMPPRFF